jgi:hypothetical protein
MVPPNTNADNLGTGAVCDEVLSTSVMHVVCANFVAPRTFTVNGVSLDCTGGTGNSYALPPARNGGYCMQASQGQYPYAYFSTF